MFLPICTFLIGIFLYSLPMSHFTKRMAQVFNRVDLLELFMIITHFSKLTLRKNSV